MLNQILDWIMKSKGVKVGAASLTGGGVIVLILGLYTSVKSESKVQELRLKEYVHLVVAPIKTEIQNLKTNIDNTNTKVNAIYEHLINTK